MDGDAPLVTVSAAGQAVVPGGTAYITEADSITLTSLDPALSGPVSGVGMTVFDVSTFPCTGFANYPRSPGVCRKILYTGPFALPVGTHTVYYSARDNVGNTAEVKSVAIFVGAPKTRIWSGLADDGDWYTPGNWRDNAVPGPNDNAVLATRDTVVVSSNSPVLRVHDLVLGDAEGLSAPVLKISTGVVSSGSWTLHKSAMLAQNTTEPIIVGTLLVYPGALLSHTQDTNMVKVKAVSELTLRAGSNFTVGGLDIRARAGYRRPYLR